VVAIAALGKLTDALIAAAAAEHGGLTVLHRDVRPRRAASRSR
jgi:predicted nucleic acid-binding protein